MFYRTSDREMGISGVFMIHNKREAQARGAAFKPISGPHLRFGVDYFPLACASRLVFRWETQTKKRFVPIGRIGNLYRLLPTVGY